MSRVAWLGTIIASLCAVQVDAEEATPAEPSTRDERLVLTQNSFAGPTGGIRVIDASSGPKGTFRLALHTEFFVARDYFVPDDQTHHFAGNLSLSVAAAEFVEVFASAQVTSAWDDSTDPSLVQRVADVLLGVKGYHWIEDWVALGGDVSLAFPGGVGDMRDTFRATSVGVRLSSNFDFRERARKAPVLLRFNAQYFFDNSSKLVDDLQAEGPLSPFERFAYGVNEVDTVRLGFGVELPFEVKRAGLRPLVEWRWDIPVDRQGFPCDAATVPVGDGCLSDAGASAWPMTLTVGLRLQTPPRGLSFTVAADVGLTGTRDFVRELAPNAPYNVILGIAYAIDPRGTPSESNVVAESLPPSPSMGRIYGLVIDEETEVPIEGAWVEVHDADESPQVSDETGRFVTYAVPAEETELRVTHPDYAPATCTAAFEENNPESAVEPMAEVTCTLTPRSVDGRLELSVVGKKQRPVPALAVVVRGASEHKLVTDDDGTAAADLPAGSYTAYVDDPAFLVAVREVEIDRRETTELVLQVRRRPNRPRVVVRGKNIVLRSQVSFATGSNEILPNSEPLLLEVADTLLRDPSIELVEIQGHTDSRGDRDVNMKLSQSRAEAVRAWLIARGVEPARLMAQGYGPDRPLVPNITAHNRARNRRVQFRIVRRSAGGVATRP